jgi:hypothetical protein
VDIYGFSYDVGLIRSTDGGETFEIENLIGTGVGYKITDDTFGSLYAGHSRPVTVGGRIEFIRDLFVSIDHGNSWRSLGFDTVSPDQSGVQNLTEHIAVDESGYVYVADHSVFRTTERIKTSATDMSIRDSSPGVSIYPNPFSDSATLELSLDQPTWANISIYDLLGRRVSKVYEGRLTLGLHHFSFSDLPAKGTYVCIIQTEHESREHIIFHIK